MQQNQEQRKGISPIFALNNVHENSKKKQGEWSALALGFLKTHGIFKNSQVNFVNPHECRGAKRNCRDAGRNIPYFIVKIFVSQKCFFFFRIFHY